MSIFHSVITEQKVFICAVCTFIERLLRAVLPDIAWDNTFLPSEEKLGAMLDEVIRKSSLKGENEGDCRIAMAQAACNAMKHVCDLLKMSCAAVGLQDVAGRYLDGMWFVKLLMNENTSMLNKLLYTIDFTDEKPSRILMNVAAILNGKEDGYNAMNASAKRKATNDTKKIIDEVQKLATDVDSIHQHIDESKAEIVSHVDEVGTKVESVRSELHETKDELLSRADAIIKKLGNANFSGKRNRSHTPEQRKVVFACWTLSQNDLKDATNGVVTHKMAFEHCASVLEDVGVKSLNKFNAVLHSIQNRDCDARCKELEAKIDASRKAKKAIPAFI